jgi:hypothetical protein
MREYDPALQGVLPVENEEIANGLWTHNTLRKEKLERGEEEK